MNTSRINRVLARMADMNLSQLLVTDPMSIDYLVNVYVQPYERFFGLLLKADGKHVLFMNNLFPASDVPLRQVWFSDTDPVTDLIAAELDREAVLGVDKDLKARFLLPLSEVKAAAGFVNGSMAIDLARGVKDAEEIELMRTASRINDAAMEKFKALIHDGVTEKEVADQMLQIYMDLGADGYSFEPIVSFGANAADPHHEPDDTVLKEGDCVLFDVGCVKDGYCSDMTRTFYYKSVSDHDRMVYDIVRLANEAAEMLIRPGVPLSQIDAAARNLITDAQYGPNFNHRLGHFIGRSEHEFGDVSSASDWLAEPGMIFSIEPGVYLVGDTGVRVEDLVLVTADGAEILNKYPKELQIIE